MFRVTITMPLFAVVQGAFLAKAKVCITKHFDVIGSYVRHPMYSDLVVMTKKQFEHTKWIYQFISTKYLEQSNQSAELIIAQRLFIETEHLDAMAMVIKKHDMKMAESDALFMESERKREIMFAKNKALIMEHEILLGKPPA
jgi:hypothetical protein